MVYFLIFKNKSLAFNQQDSSLEPKTQSAQTPSFTELF